MQKKGRRSEKKRRPGKGLSRLEHEAQAELHPARRVSSVQMQEPGAVQIRTGVGGVHRRMDGIKLRMVKDVEVFPTEIQFSCLAESESLV